MKKLFFSILITIIIGFPIATFATQPTSQFTPPLNPGIETLTSCDKDTEDCYTLLEALPQKQEDGTYKYIDSFNTSASGSDQGIGGFLNFIFQIAIGIAGVIGVVMLTIFGFQYAAQDKNINTLSDLRTKITNVIFGILLLLGIFIILRTINPDLLIVEPEIKKVLLEVDTGGDSDIPITQSQIQGIKQSFASFSATHGIVCPGSGGVARIPEIAKSMIGKINYSMDLKGTSNGNFYYLDCSSFVSQVYACAGLPSPGSTTSGIFPGTEAVNQPVNASSINGIPLKVGDLLGWMKSEDWKKPPGKKNGHVTMFIGNGKTIEVTSAVGGRSGGKAVQIHPADGYSTRLKHIKRLY